MTTVPIPSSSACYGGMGMMWRSPPMSAWLAAALGYPAHAIRQGRAILTRNYRDFQARMILLSQPQADIMEAILVVGFDNNPRGSAAGLGRRSPRLAV